MNDIDLRPGTAADHNFILSSWLRSYRGSATAFKIHNSTYYTTHHDIVQNILSDSAVVVLIACPKTDREQILGYCVSIGEICHYMYVKQPFRRLGIAKALIGASGPFKVCSHTTRDADHLSVGYFNPYILKDYQ